MKLLEMIGNNQNFTEHRAGSTPPPPLCRSLLIVGCTVESVEDDREKRKKKTCEFHLQFFYEG